jgi:hypothetical protein
VLLAKEQTVLEEWLIEGKKLEDAMGCRWEYQKLSYRESQGSIWPLPKCTRKNYDLGELQINSMYLEQVQSYKYLGSTVNSDNSMEEEIQYRITLENKAYYANQFLFKSRLVSKKSRMKLYWSIIRPIVTFIHSFIQYSAWRQVQRLFQNGSSI